MNFITSLNSNEIMYVVLTIILVSCTIYLIRLNNDKRSSIYLLDLVTTAGILNERKLTRFLTWVVSTWGFIYLLADHKLTEWYFIGYMGAWVANALIGKTVVDRETSEYTNRAELDRKERDFERKL
jgi:membrane-anchored protein YejM (alkaline phosphatase superfamily)